MKKTKLINAHTVFISTLVVCVTIGLVIYLVGLQNHSTLYHNTLITTTILASIFFVFVFVGLYKGWKLKDTLGDMRDHFSKLPKPKQNKTDLSSFEGIEVIELGEGVEGCFFAIIIWILVGLFGSVILWLIGAFFWGIILILAGLLYWVIFRAFRLVFKNSKVCRGNFIKSFQIAVGYSFLYTSWIYGIIYIVHYLK